MDKKFTNLTIPPGIRGVMAARSSYSGLCYPGVSAHYEFRSAMGSKASFGITPRTTNQYSSPIQFYTMIRDADPPPQERPNFPVTADLFHGNIKGLSEGKRHSASKLFRNPLFKG